MEQAIPRFIIAGTNSGCGKTSISCALLQALIERGLRPAAFKCGPDYIDPMFHRGIIGTESSNLDGFFFDNNTLRYLLAKNSRGADISVIEGVMGYYDGLGLVNTQGSSYEISKLTESPVILVLDAKGAALSILAIIKGFLEFYKDNKIAGVILNRCTAMSYEILKKEIQQQLNIKALGYMPPMEDCELKSRHLGLVSPEETAEIKEKLLKLAAQAEKSLDIEGIIALASSAPKLKFKELKILKFNEKLRIAYARDRAFCFYYGDNLELLREMGAELIPFSPLKDSRLPENIQGLYIGGGYPELSGEELSKNQSLLKEIKEAVAAGIPTIAECGGFMYLTEKIGAWPMVGAIETESFDTGKLSRFGYITMKAKKDGLLCTAGHEFKAHEFHYYDAVEPGGDFEARKLSGRAWDCVYHSESLYAGFPHFHFYTDLSLAENFYRACLKEKKHD